MLIQWLSQAALGFGHLVDAGAFNDDPAGCGLVCKLGVSSCVNIPFFSDGEELRDTFGSAQSDIMVHQCMKQYLSAESVHRQLGFKWGVDCSFAWFIRDDHKPHFAWHIANATVQNVNDDGCFLQTKKLAYIDIHQQDGVNPTIKVDRASKTLELAPETLDHEVGTVG